MGLNLQNYWYSPLQCKCHMHQGCMSDSIKTAISRHTVVHTFIPSTPAFMQEKKEHASEQIE